MKVIFNGEEREIASKKLVDLLQEIQTDPTACAVALNERFVPKSDYETTLLSEGDSVELLIPMQGG